MSEAEVKIECVKLATALVGGPEALDLAQRIYEFVTSPSPASEKAGAQ